MIEGIFLLVIIGLFIAYQRQHGKLETLKARIWAAKKKATDPAVAAILDDLSRPL